MYVLNLSIKVVHERIYLHIDIDANELLVESYSLSGALYLDKWVEVDDDRLCYVSCLDSQTTKRKLQTLKACVFDSEREKNWFLVVEKDPKVKRTIKNHVFW